jgi:predicted MFS family arabinose efflux permease
MEFYDLFYKWVPIYIRLPILTLLYFVLLTANGVYTGNTTDTSSGLGVYSEPYTMAYYSIYIGMSIGSMTNIRFRERFSGKSLLLGGFLVMLVMNATCATTNNPYLTVFCCLLLGIGKLPPLLKYTWFGSRYGVKNWTSAGSTPSCIFWP